MKRTFALILSLSLASFCVKGQESACVDGTVSATALNVRVKPDTKYRRICLLKFGEKVKVYKKVAGWYEIAVPEQSECWVAKSFIDKDGKVLREVNLRGGPGAAYQSYGTVDKGALLTVLSDSRSGWSKVKPLPSLRAWTSAKYIKLTPEAEARLAIIMNPQAGQPENNNAVVNDKAEPVPQLKLDFVADSKKPVVIDGMVLELKSGSGYATHAIADVKVDKKGKVTSCEVIGYLHCDTADLKMFENKRIKLSGQQQLVKGWKLPVIDVEKILYVK